MNTDLLDQLANHLPAIPREWGLGIAQGAVALAIAFGVDLSMAQQTTLVSFSALVFAGLVAGGTALRRSRLQHLSPHLSTAQLAPEDVDALLSALAALRTPATPPRGGAVVRQLERVEDAGATAAEAQAANDPEPPPPGSEVPVLPPASPSPPTETEPTGS